MKKFLRKFVLRIQKSSKTPCCSGDGVQTGDSYTYSLKKEGLREIDYNMSMVLYTNLFSEVSSDYSLLFGSLLQNATAILFQNATKVYYKMLEIFCYKMWQFYYKCDNFITKWVGTMPIKLLKKQKHLSRGVLRKRYSGNMQQIYKRTKFAPYFQKTFS